MSATVSARLMSQFATLLSTISNAAKTPSTNSGACSAVIRSAMSARRTKAISASILGCSKRVMSTAVSFVQSMSSSSTPKSG